MQTQSRQLAPSSASGSAFLITLLVMLLVFALGAAMATSMLTEITTSANYRARGAALWQADSGLERVAVDLMADPAWARNMTDFSTLPMAVANPFPMSSVFNGTNVAYQDDGTGQPVAQFYDLGGATTLDDGGFSRRIFMPPVSISNANGSGTKAWLVIPVGANGTNGTVEASSATVRSDMRVVLRRLTVWDNAVFGGAGQGAGSINGNVEIRGSMHVVGDPGDVIDAGGTAFIMNSYDNWLGDFGAEGAKLPPLPLQMFNGELVQTLDAEVRVNDGTINLGGTTTWGLPDVSGNGVKETLDGFYSDAALNTSGSAAVNAEDSGPYDATGLGFPTLDDPFYDAATSTSYATHRAYLNNNSLTIPVNEVSVDTPAFNLNDGNGNSAQWDPGTGVLQISGIVRVDGDLDLAKKNAPVHYDGTGSLYATGSVHIHDNLLPQGDYLDIASANVHNLGIIADTDLHIANGPGESQLVVMAALYAENETVIAKQSNIAGAVVANSFDLTNQVPSVWQVPILGTNLPPGMPGSEPMLFVTGADVTNWYHERR